MPRRIFWTRAGITAMLIALCWPVWIVSGMVMERIGLAELDLVGRLCLEIAFLTGCERVSRRFAAAGAE